MRHKQQEVECMKLVPVSGSAVVITFHLLPTVVTSKATIQSRINRIVYLFLFCRFFFFSFVFFCLFTIFFFFFSFLLCNNFLFAGALLTGRPQFKAENCLINSCPNVQSSHVLLLPNKNHLYNRKFKSLQSRPRCDLNFVRTS